MEPAAWDREVVLSLLQIVSIASVEGSVHSSNSLCPLPPCRGQLSSLEGLGKGTLGLSEAQGPASLSGSLAFPDAMQEAHGSPGATNGVQVAIRRQWFCLTLV